MLSSVILAIVALCVGLEAVEHKPIHSHFPTSAEVNQWAVFVTVREVAEFMV